MANTGTGKRKQLGRHARLCWSDMQTNIGEEVLQKIVALRYSKAAIVKLKAICPEEARNLIKKRGLMRPWHCTATSCERQ